MIFPRMLVTRQQHVLSFLYVYSRRIFITASIKVSVFSICMLGGAPVTTAWRVLGLRMEGRPPDMEGSCEYTE
jgi:hypothetical protein